MYLIYLKPQDVSHKLITMHLFLVHTDCIGSKSETGHMTKSVFLMSLLHRVPSYRSELTPFPGNKKLSLSFLL